MLSTVLVAVLFSPRFPKIKEMDTHIFSVARWKATGTFWGVEGGDDEWEQTELLLSLPILCFWVLSQSWHLFFFKKGKNNYEMPVIETATLSTFRACIAPLPRMFDIE